MSDERKVCHRCGGTHPTPEDREEMLDLANDISRAIRENISAERTRDGPTMVGALLYIAAMTVAGCPHENTRKAVIRDVRKSFGPLIDSMVESYAAEAAEQAQPPEDGETVH